MKPLLIIDEAEAELWDAVDFYESKLDSLGLDFEEEVSNAFKAIIEAPSRWPLQMDKSRRFLLKRFPYAVHYYETNQYIWIVAVAHQKRKPGFWRSRTATLPIK